MSSGRLASTVCPHVGGKADLSSATSAANCADQVARWGRVFRAGVSRESLATSALLYLNGNAVLLACTPESQTSRQFDLLQASVSQFLGSMPAKCMLFSSYL